jgi:N-acetylmuramoyl-L-alanine amidase
MLNNSTGNPFFFWKGLQTFSSMNPFRLLFLVVVSWLALGAPAWAARTIVIDAGHGGHDRGGIPGQKHPEKVYALDVALRLRRSLQSAGFNTVMTRDGDYFVGLRERCQIANSRSGNVFISIHFNSAKREGAAGIETYYYSRSSAAFAAAVHREVLRAAGTEDRSVRRRGFYVLRNTQVPAVLAELGFLTNRAEGSRVTSSSHRQRLADALARAIVRQYR